MRNQILGNRYRIQDRIGEGGMAYVYVAIDEKLGRKVAIKILHEHMERNQDIRKRFQMEAEAISCLEHPNIVKIYDFSGTNSERLWIVTEVIRGKNLAQYVQQFTGGWLHPIIASSIVREILKALEKAHSIGIVHRDIKPENIMLTTEGRVKLMDFGIAKDLAKSNLTLTGTFMGSPSYMSPEQIRGRDIDARSDLYSLSVLFYEIITGRLPYAGQTTHDVVLKIMEGKFTFPKFIVPSLPEALNDMIVRGMSRDQLGRFQTASEYGASIDRFLEASGFDESHIELERYFKDRESYEARLARTRIGMLRQDTASPRLTASTGRNPTRHPGTASFRQPTRHDVPPFVPAAPKASPFRSDDTWQRHMHGGRQTAAMPPLPVAPDSIQNRSVVRTRHPTEALLRAQAEIPKPVQAPPAVDVSNMRRQVGLGRPTPRLRPRSGSPQRGRARVIARFRSSWLDYLVGVMLVGILTGISIFGFWQLENRLQTRDSNRPLTGESAQKKPRAPRHEIKLKKPREGTPITVRKLSRPGSITQEGSPKKKAAGTASNTSPGLRKPRDPKAAGVRKPRPAAVVTAMPPSETGDPRIHVGNAEIRTPKAVPVHQPAPDSVQPDPAVEQNDSPPQPAPGPSRFSISSQPASEIYVDGKRVGTTVDATTSSGPVNVQPGSHSIELRRQGYATWRSRINFDPGEMKALPSITLEQLSQPVQPEGAQKMNLTIRVSAWPAQVTVRNLDSNNTQAFTLKAASRVLPVDAGRYHVRIEYNGDAREREMIFGGATRQLTFSADFKEE